MISDLLGTGIIILGALFCLIGTVGLIRFNRIYERFDVVVKSFGFGIFLIMIGVFAGEGFTGMGMRSLLCALFIWLSLPVVIYALARATHRIEKE